MIGDFILIAGKEEAFEYSDSHIQAFRTKDDAMVTVARLRTEGYKIFVISEVTMHIDDIANYEGGR